MHKPGNVLMVCLGNICRSPLAQGVFENMSKNFKIKVDSVVANYHAGYPLIKEALISHKKMELILVCSKADWIKDLYWLYFCNDKEKFHDVRELFSYHKWIP